MFWAGSCVEKLPVAHLPYYRQHILFLYTLGIGYNNFCWTTMDLNQDFMEGIIPIIHAASKEEYQRLADLLNLKIDRILSHHNLAPGRYTICRRGESFFIKEVHGGRRPQGDIRPRPTEEVYQM